MPGVFADAGVPLVLVVGGFVVAAAVVATLALVFLGVWLARRMKRPGPPGGPGSEA